MRISLLSLVILVFIGFFNYSATAQVDTNAPVLRGIRIYGEQERLPPVIIMDSQGAYGSSVGGPVVNVELDINAKTTPSLYAIFVHCNADWSEDQNVFFQDFISNRYSIIQWTTSTYSDSWHTHRGLMSFPNQSVKFKYSGNWKVKFMQYYGDTNCFAEARFFVVDPQLKTWGEYYVGFYDPVCRVTNTALYVDIKASSEKPFMDNKMIGAVLYRNNRWNQSFVASEKEELKVNDKYYDFKYKNEIYGFVQAEKQFKFEKIPAENKYRTMDFTDLANFPRTIHSVRFPFSDLRRDGSYATYDDDGALVTDWVVNYADEYVYVEFVLDPESMPVKDDVFVIGSFNNWTPDKNWQMYYDEDQRLYKLRAHIRRGRHNYLYATGTWDHAEQKVYHFSTDCLEGNSPTAGHSLYGFIYYRDMTFGGYDAIIGACMVER